MGHFPQEQGEPVGAGKMCLYLGELLWYNGGGGFDWEARNVDSGGVGKKIEDEILERLPRVLEHDPRFVTLIEGIVAGKFPHRDEFARLLDEMTELRQEQRGGFQKVDQRLDG
jgi:hypothetical protein